MTSARAHNTSEDGGEPCVRVSGLARTGPGQPAPRVHPGVLLLLSRVGFASVASDELKLFQKIAQEGKLPNSF